MNQKIIVILAVVVAVGAVASSSIAVSALAARGGGQSNNGCGLSGQSGSATQLGRDLGQGTSSIARNGGSDFGQSIASDSSGCSR
jgi:hypothetical protein